MTSLHLRPTTAADLDEVLTAESSPENRPYVLQWTSEQHLQAIDNPDYAHLIVADSETGQKLGYVILLGLLDPNHSICLGRIVITEKGKGYGKATLALVQELAFNTHHAHRLWLDVKTQNLRAQAVYRAMGFIVEGTLRECLKSGNRYESLIVMSMLREEYEAIKQNR